MAKNVTVVVKHPDGKKEDIIYYDVKIVTNRDRTRLQLIRGGEIIVNLSTHESLVEWYEVTQ